jgi:hypothetical protein
MKNNKIPIPFFKNFSLSLNLQNSTLLVKERLINLFPLSYFELKKLLLLSTK